MDLTDDEKRDAAMGCRALAHQARKDAAAQENPGVRLRFEETAQRFERLAKKFDDARR